ncbi:hypothetical protein VNI00_005561 [Paramarasmius palmivorus]|uniref:50S ribosomal protein L22, chloroplastic n=1 Tax=Paramarasmius palmivorus TaxID=297713 RepID=A0AAW0DE53_9AGAR
MQRGLLHARPVVKHAQHVHGPGRIALGQIRHASGRWNPLHWFAEKFQSELREDGSAETSAAAKRAAKAQGQRSVFEVSQQKVKAAKPISTDKAVVPSEATTKPLKAKKQEKKGHSQKASTSPFVISPQKLNMLGRQISGKPIDYAILQMQFSSKKASNRIMNMLAQARDHAVGYKNMDKDKLIVSEAWVGKGQYTKQIDIKGRGRYGIRTTRRARMTVVLKEGKTLEEKKAAERAYKMKRIVAASHVRENKPLRNPGAMWAW